MKLLSIICLLLIGSSSFAFDQNNAPVNRPFNNGRDMPPHEQYSQPQNQSQGNGAYAPRNHPGSQNPNGNFKYCVCSGKVYGSRGREIFTEEFRYQRDQNWEYYVKDYCKRVNRDNQYGYRSVEADCN